jgi:hypothetical protein
VNGPTGRKYNFVDSTRPKCLVKIYKFGKAWSSVGHDVKLKSKGLEWLCNSTEQ